MANGFKYQFEGGLFYLFIKKHYCPQCKNKLIRKKQSKVVNSSSEEAKDYDFLQVDTFLVGNIKFINYYFECSKCNRIYTIKEMKQLKI